MIHFDVVIADPPWAFRDTLSMSSVARGAEANYATMPASDLARLVIPTADDAICALWVPSSLLDDGLTVLKAWGFTLKGTFVWVKTTKDGEGLAFGMGHTFRQCHEIALIGTKGKIVSTIQDKAQRSVLWHPSTRHSTKPEGLHEALEKMWPDANRLELFARRQRDGWLCLGNEVTGNDIRLDLALLY